jgi:hypothetical protein
MDHFATASTGPSRQQLVESRSAVAAAQGITEARNTYTVVFVDPSDAPKQIGTFDNAAEAKQLIRNSYREMYDTGDHLRNVAPGIYVLEEDYRNTGEQATADNYKHMYHWIIQKSSAVTAAQGVAEGEGMSRAAKGYEKYGRAGMAALAKAGREGRALDPVRDRYDRYDEAVAEGSGSEELKAIDGDYYEDSTDFFSMFEQDHFDREEESEDGMEIRGYIDDKCVMVFKFSTPDMMGGWGIYDDSALMAEGHEDDEEGDVCPECDGAGCPECYGDEDRDRAHDHAQGMERESAGMAEAGRPDVMRHRGDKTVKVVKRAGKPIGEIGIDAEASEGNGSYYVKLYDGSYDAVGFDTAAEALAELRAAISEGITETAAVKYGVFAKGGSVGSQRFRDDPLKTFDTKKEATADARRRRSGLSKGERGYYRMGYVVKPIKDEVDEGWKQKVAGAALAGAAALGAGGAQAQSTDKYDPSWNAHSMTHHIGSDVSSTKSMNSADPSKDVNDFQRRIQKVSGPNAKGEYKVVVIQGNDIVSHYITKTPPPGWLYKEDAESKTDEGMIDSIKNTVRAANYDRLARRSNSQAVAGGGFAPPAQFKSLSAKGDQRAQKAQDIRKGSAEQVDEIDMGLVGDAVAGAAMGLGSVGLGSYIGHKIGNKIGQKFIDRSNRKEAERQAKYDREEWRSHRSEIDEKSEAVRHGNNNPSIYHVDEGIDPIEQLRADIRRFAQ